MHRRGYTTPRPACQLALIKQLWDHHADGTHRFICTKDAGGKWHQICLDNWSEQTLRQVVDRNQSSDLYFCPHGFDAASRTAGHSVLPRMLYADLDEVDPRKVHPRPTIAWQSSPGRYQCIWLLTKAPADWEVNQRLTYSIGADRGGWDLTQVLRIPGSVNYKYDDGVAGRLLWMDGDVYEVDVFDGLPEVGTAAEVDKPNGGDLGLLAQRAWKRVRSLLLPSVVDWITSKKAPGGDRSEDQWFIERSLKEVGCSREECYAVVRTEVRWNKFDDDRLWDEVGRVYADEVIESSIVAKPFVMRDIPRKDFVYGQYYARGVLSSTVASGGTGKTRLLVAEAIAMASGKPILWVKPQSAMPVWYIGEEDEDNIYRHVYAVMKHYGLTPYDLGGRLFITSMRDAKPRIAVAERLGVKIVSPMVDAIHREVRINRITCLMVDPFIKTHGVNENDNLAVEEVTSQWADIAYDLNISIMLAHHTRKGQPGERKTSDDSRGASSFQNECRLNRVAQPGDEEGWVRVLRGKVNDIARSDASEDYFINEVTLANGDEWGVIERKSGWKVKLSDGKMSWGYDLDKPESDSLIDALNELGRATARQWRQAAGVSQSSLYRSIDRLLSAGTIRRDGAYYSVSPHHLH